MKKISLNLMKAHLTRDEMRSISGGSGSSNCDDFPSCSTSADCYNNYCPNCSGGTCYTSP